MNRADRRQMTGKKYTGTEVARMLKEAELETIEFTTKKLCAVTALILHDKLGFGVQRVTKILDQISNTCECVESGDISFSDIEKVLRDELGLEIQ